MLPLRRLSIYHCNKNTQSASRMSYRERTSKREARLMRRFSLKRARFSFFPFPVTPCNNTTAEHHKIKKRQGTRPGGCSTKFSRGGSAPRSHPLPFYLSFLAEKVPFYIPSFDKWYSFHLPSSELSIPFKHYKFTKPLNQIVF